MCFTSLQFLNSPTYKLKTFHYKALISFKFANKIQENAVQSDQNEVLLVYCSFSFFWKMFEIKSFVSLKNQSLLFWKRVHFKGESNSPKVFEGGCSTTKKQQQKAIHSEAGTCAPRTWPSSDNLSWK